jgi:chitodextrinase
VSNRRTAIHSALRLILVLTVFLAWLPVHAQSGLVGWWKFDEGAGSTAADSSSFGNTGTLVSSPVWAAGRVGAGALTFNGTTNYVNVPNTSGSLDNLQASTMTVAAWIKATGTGGGGHGRIFEKGGWFFAMSTAGSSTAVRFTSQDTGGYRDSTAIALNTWVHVAATWDGIGPGSGMHIYVNGVLADNTANAGSGTPDPNDVGSASIGNRAADHARGFPGSIDDVRVYNRTLSAAEIQALADSTVPGTPSTLNATAASNSQVNLNWAATTDNVGVTAYLVERCTGSTCTTFSQVGTSAGTTFSDSGLTASTTYRYRVRATDANSNLGGYSPIANATTSSGTGDTTQPSPPSSLAVSVFSSNAITVSWGASTDNVGVTGYRVERCQGSSCSGFLQIGLTSATAFIDSGLLPSTNYTYRVRAADAAGNLSTYSGTGNTTTSAASAGSVIYTYDELGRLTQASYSDSSSMHYTLDAAGNRLSTSVPDIFKPTAPGVPVISSIAASSAIATWTAASDNLGVVAYEYQLNGQSAWTPIGNVLTYTLTALTPSTPYTFNVRAKDAASNPGVVATSPAFNTLADTTPPGAPGVPTFSNIAISSATMTWTAATDDVGVTGYEYSVNSGSWQPVGNVLTVNLTALTPNTAYSVQVRAKDQAGHAGTPSTGTFHTPSDVSPPSKPGVPGISNVTYNSATATWIAASDNVGVTAYEYRVNTSTVTGPWQPLGNVLTTGITGLAPVSTYTVAVRAFDAALNPGDFAISVPFTTAQDPIPPGAPGTPQFSGIAMTQATMTWTAASDNVAVVSYEYDLNGSNSWQNVGNVLTTTISGLSPFQNYIVRLRARDGANLPGPTSTNSFMTPDTQPPGAPGVPQVSNITQTSATISWAAASDNAGVSRYQYSLTSPPSSGWTNAGNVLSINLTGLIAGTTYPIAVSAIDVAGLAGPASSNSFTTPTYTDTPVMTVGGPIATNQGASGGFIAGSYGSMSPTATGTGFAYKQLTDQYASPNAGGAFLQSRFAVGGFGSDPGQGWLISVGFAGGTTQTGGAATYSYSAGVATWTWTTPFGIGAGNKNCTIVHR